MNRLLLVAILNSKIKELVDTLGVYFKVQLCIPDNAESVKKIATFYKPECILVITDGFEDEHGEIFRMLERFLRTTPVIVEGDYGTVNRFEDLITSRQFTKLISPRDNTTVVDMVLNKLYVHSDNENSQEAKSKPAPKSIRNILFVDDSPVVLRSLRNMLQDDFSVSIATSGYMALDQILRNKPDLVFLDFEMPNVDGRHTLAMIRSNPECSDLPVVFLTSHSERSAIESIMKLGPAGYVLKPATVEKLYTVIDSIGKGKA